jgi:branched-chain amino acid transport system ATP-binding protein
MTSTSDEGTTVSEPGTSGQAEAAPQTEPVGSPILEVEGLSAYYGSAQALEDVTFTMGQESIAIVGRNGMGKTTLCNAIMGISPPNASGSIRFEGRELVGGHSYKIARQGIGYVPQGRRLFPSLTVDEHLKIAARGTANGESEVWTRRRVYELFPRLAERKRNGGAQLSGGEQQMLAIGRALMTNPKLLVMDEPSEGLAPAIIESLIETFQQLEEQGLAILLIEQNLGVATALAQRQLIMVAGNIATETTASKLSGDSELQRRYLGVEPLAH